MNVSILPPTNRWCWSYEAFSHTSNLWGLSMDRILRFETVESKWPVCKALENSHSNRDTLSDWLLLKYVSIYYKIFKSGFFLFNYNYGNGASEVFQSTHKPHTFLTHFFVSESRIQTPKSCIKDYSFNLLLMFNWN